jgi:hypothetical protein
LPNCQEFSLLTPSFVKQPLKRRTLSNIGLNSCFKQHLIKCRAYLLLASSSLLLGCASGYHGTHDAQVSYLSAAGLMQEAPAFERLANQNTFGELLSTWPSQAIPFALLPYDQRDTREAGVRLMHELTTLQRAALVSGNDISRSAMAQWRSVIRAQLDEPLRSRDLPASERLPLNELAHWGYCLPPSWVEVWSINGVTRHPWQSSLTLEDVTGSRSHQSSHAWHISPQGQLERHGIADWNKEPVSLAPGSRVMVEWSAQHPTMGVNVERSWVNERLPRWLAAQLPGEDCQTWPQEKPQ